MIDDLGDDLAVGSSYDKSVLLGVVLVLVLLDEAATGIVISLSLITSSAWDLESLVVGLSLHNFNECHI